LSGSLGLQSFLKILLSKVPIGKVFEEDINIIGAAILIIQIVSMLPHITGQKGFLTVNHRKIGIGCFRYF